MQRHIMDKARPNTRGQLAAFTKLARRKPLNPAHTAPFRQARNASSEMLRRFTKMERHQQA
ncbi:MAG: hypothetical protein OIF40_11015 [Mangrovicoccus sp.]|nr:hypothetical protein [Mangrovicoccus sp.]